jgi:SNF2 family DNA or RNA helicase
MRDYKSGEVVLNDLELELLKYIENYSDENLMKKFSKKSDKQVFFQDAELFQNHISPYIERYIYRCVLLLMKGNVRLFFRPTNYSNLYSEDEIRVNQTFSDSVFYFNRNETRTTYNLKISHEGKPVNLLHKTIRMVCTQPCCFVLSNQLFVFTRLSGKKIIPFLTKESVVIPRQAEEKYYQSFILNTIRESEVQASGFEIIESHPPRCTVLSLENDLSLNPVIVVKFKYENNLYLADAVTHVFVSFEKKQDQYMFKKFVRDKDWEGRQLEQLKSLGLNYKNGYWNLDEVKSGSPDENYYRNIEWLAQCSEDLKKQGFQIVQTKIAKKYFIGPESLDVQVRNNVDWFDLYVQIRFGDFVIPFIRLRKHIINDIREFELPSGETAILPKEWFTTYKDIFPLARIEGDVLKIKRHHFQILQEKIKNIDRDCFSKLDQLTLAADTIPELPEGLKAELRTYQRIGYSWMMKLHENQLGGCLADDMGLGKTLQAIALLLKLKKSRQAPAPFDDTKSPTQLSLFSEPPVETPVQPASLVVMPTSLIHNWENEIRKFAPSLTVYKHIGQQRAGYTQMSAFITRLDVVLTTYGTLRNDFEMLGRFEFFYLILDESQNIKNAASKTYQSLLEIRSKHRMVITGTPIENSLSDLWSQLNFLNKGLLGSLPYFKREFITPIEKMNDQAQAQKLQKLIRPFVLRRTKQDVASDLPALTEQIRFCEMTPGQKEIYESEKSAIRNTILKNIESKGMKKSALLILQGLTKLRQLANHPSLVLKTAETDSGKFDEICRCLENIVAENHKVLIFSSFVKHLDLLQAKIESENWKYSMLTGKTTNRADVIRNFQDDPDNHIFLISLKAGGVGLNLTSADYVFIIDPWWNPAAENQAINRAHRIGQDKKVFVYRFITEDTIEEKIQTLKSRKSALADKFISSNNPFGNEMTETEIMSLFS